MNDDTSARAVSGEIMSGDLSSQRPQGQQRRTSDIVDAEFETVAATDAGAAGATQFTSWAPPGEPSAAGLGILRRDAERAPHDHPQRGGMAFWGFGLGIVLLAFWISGGHTLVRNLPVFQPAPPAPDLRIAEIKSRVETANGKSLLFVDGEVVNETNHPAALRTLSINVLDEEGSTTRYFLGTNDHPLDAGEHFGFSSRLAAPTAGVRSVSVTFMEP